MGKVTLKESELRAIVSETLREMMNEGMGLDAMKAAYNIGKDDDDVLDSKKRREYISNGQGCVKDWENYKNKESKYKRSQDDFDAGVAVTTRPGLAGKAQRLGVMGAYGAGAAVGGMKRGYQDFKHNKLGINESEMDEGFLKGFFNGMGQQAKQDAQAVGNAVGGAAKKAGQAIKSGAQTVGNAVSNGAQAVGGAIKNGAQTVGQGVANRYNAAVQAGKDDALRDDFNKVISGLNGLVSQGAVNQRYVKGFITNLTNTMNGIGQQSSNNMQQALSEAVYNEVKNMLFK